jgi:hypothetical protein
MQTDTVENSSLFQLRVNEAVGLFIIVGIIMFLAWIVFLISEYRHGFRSFNKNELRRVQTVNQDTRQRVCLPIGRYSLSARIARTRGSGYVCPLVDIHSAVE